jgi:amino acid permease
MPFRGGPLREPCYSACYWLCADLNRIVGPDYASLIAGEVKSPRRILPKAFNSIIYRIIIFYVRDLPRH